MSAHSEPPPQRAYAPAHAPGERPVRNGLGTAAFVLGLTGSVTGLVRTLHGYAALLGLLALALGLAGRIRARRGGATNRGTTTFGAVLGLVSLTLSMTGAVLLHRAADIAPAPSRPASYAESGPSPAPAPPALP